MNIKNPLYEKVGSNHLPRELKHQSINEVYDINDGEAYCITLKQTWLPYSWYFNQMDWYVSDVSVEGYGGITVPILGKLLSRMGLKVIIVKE